ncbi:MAG: hypothetical protein HZB24_04340 [Desulfobacterales bacterium]|nr:hypothetical protein [Desulfobacterales bacterium]
MFFSNDQTSQIDDSIRRLHQRTGVALTTVVAARCDAYPELAWKAFAATIVLNGLLQLFQILFPPARLSPWNVSQTIGFIIGTSAAVALLTIFWPSFGRLFLNRRRAQAKIDQSAQTLFLKRELFQRPERNALLLVIGLFEGQAAFLADRGIVSRLTPTVLEPVVGKMRPLLRRQEYFEALSQGLAVLESVLLEAGFDSAADASPLPGVGLIQLKNSDWRSQD